MLTNDIRYSKTGLLWPCKRYRCRMWDTAVRIHDHLNVSLPRSSSCRVLWSAISRAFCALDSPASGGSYLPIAQIRAVLHHCLHFLYQITMHPTHCDLPSRRLTKYCRPPQYTMPAEVPRAVFSAHSFNSAGTSGTCKRNPKPNNFSWICTISVHSCNPYIRFNSGSCSGFCDGINIPDRLAQYELLQT